MHADRNSDHVWLTPWLNWFDTVEATTGRTSFPEDPDFTHLHRWFKAGLTPAAAVAKLQGLRAV